MKSHRLIWAMMLTAPPTFSPSLALATGCLRGRRRSKSRRDQAGSGGRGQREAPCAPQPWRAIVLGSKASVGSHSPLPHLEDGGLLCLQGDSTRDADLLTAQVNAARGLVAATGDDAENVYISLTARGLNPKLHIVARASSSDAEDKLRRAGADQVVSPYDIGGRQMAISAIESQRQSSGK